MECVIRIKFAAHLNDTSNANIQDKIDEFAGNVLSAVLQTTNHSNWILTVTHYFKRCGYFSSMAEQTKSRRNICILFKRLHD